MPPVSISTATPEVGTVTPLLCKEAGPENSEATCPRTPSGKRVEWRLQLRTSLTHYQEPLVLSVNVSDRFVGVGG